MSSISNRFLSGCYEVGKMGYSVASEGCKMTSKTVAGTAFLAKEITSVVGTVAIACMGFDTFNFIRGEIPGLNAMNACKVKLPILMSPLVFVKNWHFVDRQYCDFVSERSNDLFRMQADLFPVVAPTVVVATLVSYLVFNKIESVFTVKKENPVL